MSFGTWNPSSMFTRNESVSESENESGSSEGHDTRHKVVVMGGPKVGKSSIIHRFLYNTFSPKYKRTIEEMHHEDFSMNGVHLKLDILDTSGTNEFPAMRALSISSADAFILVYAIDDPNSFEEIRLIRDHIFETKASTAVPIVVVGNKSDLADENRQVPYDTTESVVQVDWENGFVEASAKDNTNITQVFKELLVQAKVKYNLSPALRRRRRQSLPPVQHSPNPVQHSPNPAQHSPNPPAAPIPSPAELQHLQSLREKHSSRDKRNSCAIS
ncbi:hypothetical protein M8J75_001347 [Diaphorina citri]|nr:hypothetical protein M8J75_001347 [Diaphorina citri]